MEARFKKGDIVYLKPEWSMPFLKDWKGPLANVALKIMDVYCNEFGYTYDIQRWDSYDYDKYFWIEVNEKLLV